MCRQLLVGCSELYCTVCLARWIKGASLLSIENVIADREIETEGFANRSNYTVWCNGTERNGREGGREGRSRH